MLKETKFLRNSHYACFAKYIQVPEFWYNSYACIVKYVKSS